MGRIVCTLPSLCKSDGIWYQRCTYRWPTGLGNEHLGFIWYGLRLREIGILEKVGDPRGGLVGRHVSKPRVYICHLRHMRARHVHKLKWLNSEGSCVLRSQYLQALHY